MIHSAADKKTYDDKNPESLRKLASSVKTRIELYKENINNAVCYPLQTEQSREHARGQIAGIAAATKILFKFNILKTIGEDIDYFKFDKVPQPDKQEQLYTHYRR